MADSRLSRPLGLPIGPNGQLVQGTLLLNNNGDAEWFQGSARTPTFTSNASDNYQWKPSPGGFIVAGQKEAFYATPTSTTTLNNARLQTWNSPTGYNSPQLAKQLNIPGSNVAPTPPNPDQQTAPPPPVLPPPGQGGNPDTSSPSLTFASASGLRYPKEITSNQDRIKFQAAEILPRTSPTGEGSLTSGFQFQFPKPTVNTVDGPVIIAIQSPISDQNSVDWGPNSINAIDSALYNASYGYMKSKEPDKQVPNFFKDLLDSVGDYQGRIQRYLAGQAASVSNILARTDNVVLNPNLELLFQGPQLRPFTFQFKMSARNQPEADEIRRIINYFKYHMAVREEKGIFLKAPHVFKIQYEKGEGELHPGINLISPIVRPDKACALTNCSVDYTPLGSYMTYEDGTMVSYTLSLQFQELTPILDTDYEDVYTQEGAPMSIGY